MTDKFIDVHTFDHKLVGMFNQQRSEDILSQQTIEKVKEKLSNIGKQMFMAILEQKQENYDDTNKISATDILIDIIHKIDPEEESIIKLLDEQLSDTVNLGQCPQGRATRLLQIWSALI